MADGQELKFTTAVLAAVGASFVAYQAASVLAPLALALFIIAIVCPVQHRLQSHLPTLVALAITIIITAAACLAFASFAAWGFGRVGRSFIANAARYQELYDSLVKWLYEHDVSVA